MKRDLILVPYAEMDGQWSLSDVMLNHVWNRMLREGTWLDVFHSGEIIDAETFIGFLKDKANAVVSVWTLEDIVLLAWLNGIKENTALGHFCGFRGMPRHEKLKAAEMVTDYWFGFQRNGGPWFSVLCGLIPGCNDLAIRFMQDLGWTVAGRVPKLIRHHYRDEDVDGEMVYKENVNGRG